jgi:hypothetical protein
MTEFVTEEVDVNGIWGRDRTRNFRGPFDTLQISKRGVEDYRTGSKSQSKAKC